MKTKKLLFWSKNIVYALVMISYLPSGGAEEMVSKPDSLARMTVGELRQIRRELAEVNGIIDLCDETLMFYSENDFAPRTLFQKAQLLIKRNKLYYALDIEKYELKYQLFEEKMLKTAPEEPVVDYTASIEICQQLLENNPNVDFEEDVRYWYAICLYESQQQEEALKQFEALLGRFPQSDYANEINFRIAEYFFDQREFSKSLRIYQNAVKEWDNPFFGMSLYKIAWCYYLAEDYNQAISTFYYLLNDLDLLDANQTEALGKTKLDLKEETIDYIAISFYEVGGLPRAYQFLESIQSKEVHWIEIAHSMANILHKRDYHQKALDIYGELLAKYPFYEKAPEIVFSMYECYRSLDNPRGANRAYTDLKTKFGLRSEWSLRNPGSEIVTHVVDMIAQVSFIEASPMLETAANALALGQRSRAIDIYRGFLESYPRDERSPKVLFTVGECYYDNGQFRKAAAVYQQVVNTYPENEYALEAAYNRVICYDLLYQQDIKNAPAIMKYAFKDSVRNVVMKSQGQKEFITACAQFLKNVPHQDRSVEIALKMAQEFFNLQQSDICGEILNQAVVNVKRFRRGKSFYPQVAELLAQTYYKQERFKLAEQVYGIVSTEARDSLDLREKSRQMMATASYKNAEKMMAEGDSLNAAHELEMISLRYPRSDLAQTATWSAATIYEHNGKELDAASTYDTYARRYPRDKKSVQALSRAGLIYENNERFFKAGQNYQKIYQQNRTGSGASAALLAACIAFEKSKKWRLTASTYDIYLRHFPVSSRQRYEMLSKRVHALIQLRDYLGAQPVLMQINGHARRLARQRIAVDSYLVARNLFYTAELEFRKFKGLRLAHPLEKSMQRKQAALNTVLEKYLAATKYKEAEWTTASFNQIGSTFEEIARAIQISPAPPGMSSAQEKQYRSTLEQQMVVPFLEKACEYYQANERMSAEAAIQNKWVEKSRARLEKLNPKLVRTIAPQIPATATAMN
ncbi:tetratricopeptide repeat protein [bacterium]|nr:tetratricopeptide repeat protein [bacterium]